MKASEALPAVITLALALPATYAFAGAIADGEARRTLAPARAMLGEQVFAALQRGETTEQGYMGRNRTAPDFTLSDRSGKPWKLSDHRGKVVVMNFWSITCQPCVEEMPSLEQLALMLGGHKDVELVTVSTDAGWSQVSPIFGPDTRLKVLFDSDKAIVRGKYGTRLYPETWLIDRDGVIRYRIDGARDWGSALALDLIKSLL
jgi:peroxiredoxin